VTDYRIITTSVVPALTEVRFYDETVEKIRLGHPEVPIALPSMHEAIAKAVKDPTQVEQSRLDAFVFVDATTTNASGDPLKVPVKVVEDTSGRVSTAYFGSTTAIRNVIYRRDER
jgi:hypothetical protein